MSQKEEKTALALDSCHPVTVFFYLAGVILFSVFLTHPVAVILSLLGGAAFSAQIRGWRKFFEDLAFYLPLFLLVSLTNPLFSHNGATPLFFLNGNPVTMEAILYGMDLAAMMVAVLLWCQCFSALMTSEKILCLFGRMAPRLSLTLSMSLRFLPLFRQRWHEIRVTQMAMGYHSEKSVVGRLANSARIFSALLGWALENAVDTAASMRARGYGLRGRTYFSPFRFSARDGILLLLAWMAGGGILVGMGCGALSFSFYPRLTPLWPTGTSWVWLALFGAYAMLPAILEITEVLRWKYYRSGI